MDNSHADVEAIARIPAVPTILDVVCRTTGMGFAAVARVTEDRWIVCSVKDEIAFGLQPGGELKVETTICHEVRERRDPVIINHAARTKSTASILPQSCMASRATSRSRSSCRTARFFGTLCAIDPKPRMLNTPEVDRHVQAVRGAHRLPSRCQYAPRHERGDPATPRRAGGTARTVHCRARS